MCYSPIGCPYAGAPMNPGGGGIPGIGGGLIPYKDRYNIQISVITDRFNRELMQ